FEGHAIEARLYAEDPYDGWKPQSGRITGWRPEAAESPGHGTPRGGVRIDHGIAAGTEVTPHYDALLAKFIAHGRDRTDAVRRLVRALEQAPLFGPASNARFLRDLIQHPRFAAATMTTTLLDEWQAGGAPLLQRPVPHDDAWRIAAALLAGDEAQRPASVSRFDLTLQCDGQQRTLRAPPPGVRVESFEGSALRVAIDGRHRRLHAVRTEAGLQLAIDGAVFGFREPSPLPAADAAADPRRACAPVAGVVAQLAVAVGERVALGQPLVCVEAMKMEIWLHAAAAGRIKAVHAVPKASVAAGALLVELDSAE
ncbi:MAG: carbamoyl-phosphate synthase subunit L, partial [Comamonadaceae bacterium]|nr:carbamoyl-phosphate synthase subunit L [Comamonadaceae bacterium]